MKSGKRLCYVSVEFQCVIGIFGIPIILSSVSVLIEPFTVVNRFVCCEYIFIHI